MGLGWSEGGGYEVVSLSPFYLGGGWGGKAAVPGWGGGPLELGGEGGKKTTNIFAVFSSSVLTRVHVPRTWDLIPPLPAGLPAPGPGVPLP